MELFLPIGVLKILLPLLAIIAAVFVITTKNAIISVFNLIVLYILVAFYLIYIGITYLGISYIVVYIGAIAILFLFVIMMIDIEVVEKRSNNYLPLLFLLLGGFFFTLKNILYNIGIVKMKSLSINIIRKPVVNDNLFNIDGDIFHPKLNTLEEDENMLIKDKLHNSNLHWFLAEKDILFTPNVPGLMSEKKSNAIVISYNKKEPSENDEKKKMDKEKSKEYRDNDRDEIDTIVSVNINNDFQCGIPSSNSFIIGNSHDNDEIILEKWAALREMDPWFTWIKSTLAKTKVSVQSKENDKLILINKLKETELEYLYLQKNKGVILSEDVLNSESWIIFKMWKTTDREERNLLRDILSIKDLLKELDMLLSCYSSILDNIEYSIHIYEAWLKQLMLKIELEWNNMQNGIALIMNDLIVLNNGSIIGGGPYSDNGVYWSNGSNRGNGSSTDNGSNTGNGSNSFNVANNKSNLDNEWNKELYSNSNYVLKDMAWKDKDLKSESLESNIDSKIELGFYSANENKTETEKILKSELIEDNKLSLDVVLDNKLKTEGEYIWNLDIKFNKLFAYKYEEELQNYNYLLVVPDWNSAANRVTQISAIGDVLYTVYHSYIYIISVLLLLGMIGAIVLTADNPQTKEVRIIKKFVSNSESKKKKEFISFPGSNKISGFYNPWLIIKWIYYIILSKSFIKVLTIIKWDKFIIVLASLKAEVFNINKVRNWKLAKVGFIILGLVKYVKNYIGKLKSIKIQQFQKLNNIKRWTSINMFVSYRYSLILPFFDNSKFNTLHSEGIIGNLFYFIIATLIIAALLLFINSYFSLSVKYLDKGGGFECGFTSFVQTRERFNVIFYRVSLLFLVFDLEIILIFPYTAIYQKYQNVSKNNVLAFLYILIVGFIYELKEGALNIVKKAHVTEINNLE
jgi:NADH:ubiquinone oxidoreductase subunit 6 (subunit J)/NADH:ubiquinone oxidoreductase subunit 3 (subunit A)